MKRMIQWSIDHHWLVIGLSLLLFAAGAWTAWQMPIDVFPDLTAPTVTILTEGHGMAPEEMESLVTFPLETAVLGAAGVEAVRSQSAAGLSVVYVEFGWDVKVSDARQTGNASTWPRSAASTMTRRPRPRRRWAGRAGAARR